LLLEVSQRVCPQIELDKIPRSFILQITVMTNEEFQLLAQRMKDGNATDAEKLAFVKEVNAELGDAVEILRAAQKAN
jgi:hypothetical protein